MWSRSRSNSTRHLHIQIVQGKKLGMDKGLKMKSLLEVGGTLDIYFFYSEDYSCCFSPTWGDIGSHSLGELAVPPTAVCSLLPPLGTRPVWTPDGSRPKGTHSLPGTQRPQTQVSGSPWPHSTKELQDVEGGSDQRSRPSCLLPH